MWTEFLNMTVPALVGSGVTLTAIVLTNQRKTKKLNMEVDAAQDFVWLDLVKQSRIEYALQRKENNRLRYITHHLQEEVTVLEHKNSELQQELVRLRALEE
jgi:hypothetical protein